MQAGLLRHLVTFEQLVTELDSDGQQIETWNPAFEGQMLSAEISPLSGRELIAAQAVQSKTATRIKIRYRPGVDASMRVRHRTVIYNIEGVIPDPESGIEWITLACTSGANEG